MNWKLLLTLSLLGLIMAGATVSLIPEKQSRYSGSLFLLFALTSSPKNVRVSIF
jgi:hypothetical protein